MALKNNTWTLNQWYDQDVSGNVSYIGATELWVAGDGRMTGASNNTKYSSPVQIPGTNWGGPSSIANIKLSTGIGEGFRIWLKSDGTLWGAGAGAAKLGQNNNTAQSSPKQVGSGTDWRSLDSSWGLTVASKTDGTLWAWGENLYGALGDGTTTNRSSPKQIPGTTWGEWVATSSSSNATFCIKTDGTLWGWGRNAYGSLGQNSITTPSGSSGISSPVQIPGDWSNPKDMASKAIIKSDGTLWAWGQGGYGQLGETSTINRSSPTQIPGTTWSRITRDASVQLGIKTDGTLWAWGRGDQGQLGQNSVAHYSSPTQIPGTTWASVVTDQQAVLASKTDGTLWGWGENTQYGGSLGQNNRTDYSSPVQLPGTNWREVGAVNSYGMTAYKEL